MLTRNRARGAGTIAVMTSFPRKLALLGALGAVALGVSSCGTVAAQDAATIKHDGQTVHIERAAFTDELHDLLVNKEFMKLLKANQFSKTMTPDKPDSKVTAIWLTTTIYQQAIDDQFAAQHLKLTKADLKTGEANATQSFGDAKVFKKFSKPLRTALIEREAKRVALQTKAEADAKAKAKSTTTTTVAPPTDADAQKVYDENQAQITACESGKEVAHILVKTQAEADKILADIKAGAAFADQAKQFSTDGSAAAGGSLGCLQAGAYVAEFQTAADAAAFDQVVGPVKSQYGYHLILVTKWDPSFEHLKPQILSQLQQQAAQAAQQAGEADAQAASQKLTDDLAARLTKFKVDVDPKYGTWTLDKESKQYSVVAPKAPAVRKEREKGSATTTTSTTTP